MPTLKYKVFENNTANRQFAAVDADQQSQNKRKRIDLIRGTNVSLATGVGGVTRDSTENNHDSGLSAKNENILSGTRPKIIESNVQPTLSEKERVFLTNHTFPRLVSCLSSSFKKHFVQYKCFIQMLTIL